MVFFNCELCKHKCQSMQTFTKHIASKKHKELVEQHNDQQKIKTLQLQIKKYNCIYCNKEYVRQKKYSEHQLKCGSNTSLIQKDNTPNKLVQMQQCITNNINNINLTQNNTNTTNNNYFIMPFGKEDLSMISEDKRKYIISRGFSAYRLHWVTSPVQRYCLYI